MNRVLQKIRGVRGSALLVALLVMGVFMAISLALSTLIFREVRITTQLIDAGKAYYAAESGVEEALYHLDQELPGWQAEDGGMDLNDETRFEYDVANQCDSYPCLDEDDYELGNVPLYAYYDVLELNETITIPLFVVEDGEVRSVENFTVEFFGEFNPNDDLLVKGSTGWDVLRWKVFGMTDADGDAGYVTESINDFTAISEVVGSGGEDLAAGASTPAWFGTQACGDEVQGIQCLTYQMQSEDGKYCSNLQVRDYYFYEQGEVSVVQDCYPISTFMELHQPGKSNNSGEATGLNYLTLTNLMNPAMFDSEKEKFDNRTKRQERSRIYFRVETYDQPVVREYAEISSDGYSGDSKQSIDVRIKKDSYMPVFNFSVYSTYGSEDY